MYLTIKYLSYETEIAVGFDTPVDAPTLNLSLCFNLNTILSGYQIETFDDHEAQFLDLTTREIMDRVPAANGQFDQIRLFIGANSQVNLVVKISSVLHQFAIVYVKSPIIDKINIFRVLQNNTWEEF